MIKSDKEMKNNGLHHSSSLKLLSNATFANIFPGLAILSEKRKTRPWKDWNPSQK